MRRIIRLLAAGCVLAASPLSAQTWIDQVFPERSFDFGTVARASKVHHTFKLINRTNQDIHIANWETKCGCTEVKVGAREIPPGTQTTIEAVIDTTKFEGYKPSGLVLVLDRPEYTRVDLKLSCFIRGDVTLSPGQVDFGIVPRATEKTVTLNLSYTGGVPNWGVVQMKTQSKQVAAKLNEQGRSADGRVNYQLNVTLKPGLPTGYFKDVVTLYTNDPTSPTLPVAVAANVQGAVTVSPSIVNLGHVRAGEVVTKKVLVRSSQPFKLAGLKGSKDDLTGVPDDDGARPLHTVSLTFKAPRQPGPYNAVFEIETDVKDEPPAVLKAFATIAP